MVYMRVDVVPVGLFARLSAVMILPVGHHFHEKGKMRIDCRKDNDIIVHVFTRNRPPFLSKAKK